MNLNFANFRVEKTANTKVGHSGPTGQTFDFRYKKFISSKKDSKGVKEDKEDSFFEFSIAEFNKLQLNDYGMIQTIASAADGGQTYLAIVDNDKATIVKRTGKNKADKGKKFKSSIIESALQTQGIIDTTKVGISQKLSLVLVEGSAGQMLGGTIKTYGVYEVVKSTDTTPEADEVEATSAPAVSTPVVDEVAPETTDEVETAPVASATPAATTDDEEF